MSPCMGDQTMAIRLVSVGSCGIYLIFQLVYFFLRRKIDPVFHIQKLVLYQFHRHCELSQFRLSYCVTDNLGIPRSSTGIESV